MYIRMMPLALALGFFACSEKSSFNGQVQQGQTFKQVDANRIEFGDVDVFRIGDGTSGIQSACASELGSYDLKGTTYYLVFEALEDDTDVSMSLDKLCGVDAAGFTAISLVKDGSSEVVQSEVIVPIDSSAERQASASWAPYPSFKLGKGTFAVKIVSKNVKGNPGGASPGVDEFDDFIVGKINLNAQKPLKAIKVYAE